MTNADLIARLQTLDPDAPAEIAVICDSACMVNEELIEVITQENVDENDEYPEFQEKLQEMVGRIAIWSGDR